MAYDIAETDGAGAGRLRSVAGICEGYGVRAQFSVFECRLSPQALARLIGELEDAIDPKVDSVHIYRFSASLQDSRVSLGIVKHQEVHKPWLF